MSGIRIDLTSFRAALAEKTEAIQKATRPAAQAGAQVLYDQARQRAPIGKRAEHYFYGSASKRAPKGAKRAAAYGPFRRGALQDAIYQVYSKDNSTEYRAVYHVSFNRQDAPYGLIVEKRTGFFAGAVHDSAHLAEQAMRERFLQEMAT